MMKDCLVILLALFTISCGVIPFPKKVGDVAISGHVFDIDSGDPIENATLLIAYPPLVLSDTYQYEGKAITDDSGKFTFKQHPKISMQTLGGQPAVHVYASGYHTVFIPLKKLKGKENALVYLKK